MRKLFLIATAVVLCACSPVASDDARVSILLTADELRAVIIATEYGPNSTRFTEDADMRRALERARQKMIGASAGTG